MGFNYKCDFKDCLERVISCFNIYEGENWEVKEYKFSCLNHEKLILEQIREKYSLSKYFISIIDVPEFD